MFEFEKKLTPKEYPDLSGYCSSSYAEEVRELNEKFGSNFSISSGSQNSGAFPLNIKVYNISVKFGRDYNTINFELTVFQGHKVYDEIKEILNKKTTLLRKRNAIQKIIIDQHVKTSNVGDLLTKVINSSISIGIDIGVKENQKVMKKALGL